MKEKFWLCKRKGVFIAYDSSNGRRESLHTRDREEAKRIIEAKNSAARQPALNVSIARAYLVGTDPKLMERTWAFVMKEFCSVGKESTRLRRRRAVRSKAFAPIRNKKLIETTAEDFLTVSLRHAHVICALTMVIRPLVRTLEASQNDSFSP